MARNAGHALHSNHSRRRHTIPLRNGLRRKGNVNVGKGFRKPSRAARRFQRSRQRRPGYFDRIHHLGIESIAFIEKQAKLSELRRAILDSFCPAMTTAPKTKAARIKLVRKRHEMTQEQFASALKTTRGSVGNWELGKGITPAHLTEIAERFSVSLDWLMRGKDDLPAAGRHIDSAHILPELANTDGARDVRLVGYVGANAQEHRYAVEEQELERVHRPIGATAATVALEIRGVSMGKMFDRWLVYYDERRSPVTDDMLGKLCVVGLADGRVLVKELQRGKGGLYNLLSPNDGPMRDEAVEWAALVNEISRKR